MKKTLIRMLSLVIAVCCVCGLMAPAAFAAPTTSISSATIDPAAKGSISIYKYDYTNSDKDGVYDAAGSIWEDGYTSTGVADSNVQESLGEGIREGDLDNTAEHPLGNGETSNGYAIKGVEFTYLRVAELYTYTKAENGVNQVILLYGIEKDDALLTVLNLEADDRYANADVTGSNIYYFESDTLIGALNAALVANPTATKNALEAYITTNGGTAMDLTGEDGYTNASDLDQGLYLLIETKVPEMVTATVNPFFVSLPMTSVDGDNAEDGGYRWIYDVTLYPKNETGIVTLEKTVKESVDTEYSHNATASTNDVVDYQIISTLPTITSSATYLTAYTFVDTLSDGLTYNKDVVLEWYSDKDCKNLVATWKEEDNKFTATYGENNTMTIAMTALGLAEINTAADAFNNVNNDGNMMYAGYSNYTVRVVYSATLDSDDSFTYGDEGNDNDVALTWKRTSDTYYDVITDDCHVYSYGINLTKTFSDLTNAAAEAAGKYDAVKFMLQNTTDGYFVVAELNETEGVYYVTGQGAAEANGTVFSPVTAYAGTEKEAHGQIIIKGLEDDTYVLTEVATANGYVLLKDSITINITAAEDTSRVCSVYDDEDKLGVYQNDGHYYFEGCPNLPLANIPQAQLSHYLLTASATIDGNAVVMLADTDANGVATASTNAAVPVSVKNNAGFELPETGDQSLLTLTVLCSVAIVCAGVLLFVVIRGKKQEIA